MLTDLTRADFDFLRKYAGAMQTCHETEFMQAIDPDMIRAFYRGKKEKDNRFSRMGRLEQDKHILMLSTIFSSANTILPNLYYQNPSPIIQAIRESTPEAAALLTAMAKQNMKENDGKRENQEACLNGYFFGLGWKKLGYQKPSAPSSLLEGEPESMGQEEQEKPFNFLNLLKPTPKPDTLQSKSRMEFSQEEGIFNASESPMNVMLDHKADLANGKAILHRLPRTLYELMNFGAYEEETLTEIYNKFKHVKGSRLETREIDLTLLELHVRQRNGIWILTWIDGFDKPLQYELSTWQGKGFQFEPLVFTNEPGVRYPIAHMKIAVQVQDKIDKMASLFYEQVSRARNVLFINQQDLAKGQLEAIQSNKIQGIVLTDKAVNSGTFAHAQSPAVQNDLPTLMQIAQANLIEVMGADAQLVQGKSKNDTLGQDELARVGTKIRESGMQDRVRDWMIKQVEKESKLLQTYSEGEVRVIINPDDFADPRMRGDIKPSPEEFMTQANPISLKSQIQGDFNYDVNIEEAVKPDRPKIRESIERIIITYNNPMIKMDMNNNGKILRTDKLFEKWLGTEEILGNPLSFLEDVDSMQLAAMQTKEMLMKGGMPQGAPPSPGKPKGGADVAGKTPNDAPQPASSQAAML